MSSTDEDSSSNDFEVIDHHEARLGPDDVASINEWLQPTDYDADSGEFKRHLSSQAPGTGKWIQETSSYREWYDSENHGSIWIKGVPGAGKSVVAASLVDYFQALEQVPVLFFFFRDIIESNRRPISLVRDWLAQLLPYSSRLQHALRPLVKTSSSSEVSFRQLWDYLTEGLSSVEKAYCVVDALDEMQMESGDTFLRELNSLAAFRPKNVKLVLTSRPKKYLQSVLIETSIVHISLQQDLVGRDIAAYVAHRVRSMLKEEKQRDELALLICSRSRGLFLYARLILDQISESLATGQEDVTNLASSLPVGLEAMYDSVLSQKASELEIPSHVQVFILYLVTQSSRALRLSELANCLVFSFSDTFTIQEKDLVRQACGSLLEVLEDETVQVIHHSFTEFLLGSEQSHVSNQLHQRRFPILDPIKAHRNLALICLNYLKCGGPSLDKYRLEIPKLSCNCLDQDCYHTIYRRSDPDYLKARLQYPFLQYAIENWTYHGQKYLDYDEDFFENIEAFLNSTIESKTGASCSLHIAAYVGLTEYAKWLLKKGGDVNSLDINRRTPIWWAADRGHVQMVSFLLEKGAKPDEDDINGSKPLHQAALGNHAACVRILLELGVDLMTPKTREDEIFFSGREHNMRGDTAVYYASRGGHVEAIGEMLPFAKPSALTQLLCECCRYRKPDSVELILDKSEVSPDSVDNQSTALSIAVRNLDYRSVRALLASGANPNLTSEFLDKRVWFSFRPGREESRTPLSDLIWKWDKQSHPAAKSIFDMLVHAGVDLGTTAYELILFDTTGDLKPPKPPFFYAISELLKAGANVTSRNERGETILSHIIERSLDVKLVEILLQYGSSLETRTKTGKTVWHSLFHRSKWNQWDQPDTNGAFYIKNYVEPDTVDDVAKCLLHHGAGALIHLTDSTNHSGLDRAVSNSNCSIETLRLLFETCSDREAKEKALWNMDQSGKDDIETLYRQVIAADVSIDARDPMGKTILLCRAHKPAIFRALLSCGARLDAVDNRGRGVLHHYVTTPYSTANRLHELVELDLNPNTLDRDGNTIFHVAASAFFSTDERVGVSFECLEAILRLGVSANLKNYSGRTALHSCLEHYKPAPFGRACGLKSFLDVMKKEPDFDINAQDTDGFAAIHAAAMKSDELLDDLLSAGADPLLRTKHYENALHIACRERQIGAVGRLLHETGVQLRDATNLAGQTPLHLACRSGMAESVDWLLASGANITIRDNRGRTPLQACAEFAVEHKIWVGARDERLYHGSNLNPRWAREMQIGTIANMLIKAGADEQDRKQALELAIQFGMDSKELIDVLLKNINSDQEPELCRRSSGTTPLGFPSFMPKLDTSDQTIHPGFTSRKPKLDTSDPFFQDVMGHPDSYIHLLSTEDIEVMLENGFDATGIKSGFKEDLPLHRAVEKGVVVPVQYLAEAVRSLDKIDPEEVSECYYGPARWFRPGPSLPAYAEPLLHTSTCTMHPNIHMMRVLIEDCGVDVNSHSPIHLDENDITTSVPGPTALHLIAEGHYWWHLEAIKYLVQKGADINCKDHNGLTPLHISCGGQTLHHEDNGGDRSWSLACAELLLDLGANPNALDNRGRSPLCCTGANPRHVELLLRRGADVNAGDINPLFSVFSYNNLPRDFSDSRNRNYDGFAAMIDAGANVNAQMPAGSLDLSNELKTVIFGATFEDPSFPLHIDLLIRNGADLFATLNDQETLLHYIFEHGKACDIEIYLKHADSIDWNAIDQRGRTVFLAACEWKHGSLIEFRDAHIQLISTIEPFLALLKFGADPLARDHDGRNALHILLCNDLSIEEKIMEFLSVERHHSLIFQKDNHGHTPFYYALEKLRPAVCNRLIDITGNIVPEPRNDGLALSALHLIAAQYLREEFPQPRNNIRTIGIRPPQYYEDCLRLWKKILDMGADVNAQDTGGHPPLYHYIAKAGYHISYHPPSRRPCVDHAPELFRDEDLLVRGGNGETALHWVATAGGLNREQGTLMFRFLLSKGLDPLAEDERGRTSLDVAAANHKRHLLELFRYDS